MNEWGVVGVLIALFTFGVAVITPIIKLNTTITKLASTVENLIQNVQSIASDLGSLNDRNADTHRRMFDTLNNHETRITIIEKEIQK